MQHKSRGRSSGTCTAPGAAAGLAASQPLLSASEIRTPALPPETSGTGLWIRVSTSSWGALILCQAWARDLCVTDEGEGALSCIEEACGVTLPGTGGGGAPRPGLGGGGCRPASCSAPSARGALAPTASSTRTGGEGACFLSGSLLVWTARQGPRLPPRLGFYPQMPRLGNSGGPKMGHVLSSRGTARSAVARVSPHGKEQDIPSVPCPRSPPLSRMGGAVSEMERNVPPFVCPCSHFWKAKKRGDKCATTPRV